MCFGPCDFVCRRRFFVIFPPFCLLQLNIRPQMRHARPASCHTLHCEPRLFYLSEASVPEGDLNGSGLRLSAAGRGRFACKPVPSGLPIDSSKRAESASRRTHSPHQIADATPSI